MITNAIDLWNAATFDDELSASLSSEAALIRDYMRTDDQIFLTYDYISDPKKSMMRPENPYGWAFQEFTERIMDLINSRTIRAWHYTRLTRAEVDKMRHEGIYLSTPETLRARLSTLVACGHITAGLADSLFAASPFQGDQLQARTGKFWMASHPVEIGDPGVERLLLYWGGEVASFWTKAPELLVPISAAGIPRVIEVAVPLASTQQSYPAALAAIAAFGRTIGCIPAKHAFDVCVTAPLSRESILRIHSKNDDLFQLIARGYPEGYTDVDRGHWKELTGEDD